MAEKKKIYRLGKVANEFNISAATAAEFLNKKGHEIEADNLNKKLTPEMYDLLAKEFQADKQIKEEVEKISIFDKKDKKSKSVDAKQSDEAPAENDEILIIKDNTINIPKSEKSKKDDEFDSLLKKIIEPEKPKIDNEKKTAAIDTDSKKSKTSEEKTLDENVIDNSDKKGEEISNISTSIQKPKILGKINLPEKPTKKSKSKKAEDKLETKQEKEVKDTPKASEKTQPEIKEEKKETVTEETITTEVKEEQKSPVEEVKETPEKEIEVVEEKQKEEVKPQEEVEEEKEIKEVKEEKKKEEPKTDEPNIKDTKNVEKAEIKAEEKEESKEEEAEEDDDNFLATKYIKLEGVTVTGTLDLDAFKEKPKKKHTSEKGGKPTKKNRKRITKKDDDLTDKDDDGNKKRSFKDKSKSDRGGSKEARGKKTSRRKRKESKKAEFTEEDIRKNVQETLKSLEHKERSKAVKRRRDRREAKEDEIRRREEAEEARKNTIQITEFITVNELAALMNVNVAEVIQTCLNLGVIVAMNQRLDAETLTIVADEFGYELEFVSVDINEYIEEPEIKEEDLVPRTPIVTVMGHVDHGKTKLLDYIRNANVIAGEAGGITQHIGAYEVTLSSGKKITFLDTPGHEAFTAMRARGAQITDIAIIVIAADAKVMPQTIEAINHAQAANVPIVIAINKIDLPTANPDKIKEELSKIRILVEDWGGNYQCQEISAKKGDNVDLLLEKVLLEAEMLDLKGNPNMRAEGTIIESALDKGRGYVAKMLVRNGTLRKGDIVLAGTCYGKVKALFNERNQNTDNCGPSTPVLMLGLNGAPQAGDQFLVFEDEKEAKNIANKRQQLAREIGLRTQKHITLDEIGRRIAIGDFKELNIIVKADVDGSIEALSESLLKLSTEEIQVNVIHQSVGQITDNDVMLASASDAIIVGFQVRPSGSARKLAEQEQIDIRTYSVIYKAIEEITDAIEGMLSPEIEEVITCNVEIKEVFKISKVGTVAGCIVQSGTITRNTNVRLIRDGIVVYTGKLGSLKRFKDDVKEVKSGYECGLNIENFNDIKVGDIIEGYEEIEHQRKL